MASSGPYVLALLLVTCHLSLVTDSFTFVLATADNDVGECRGHCEGAEVAQSLLAVPVGGNARDGLKSPPRMGRRVGAAAERQRGQRPDAG